MNARPRQQTFRKSPAGGNKIYSKGGYQFKSSNMFYIFYHEYFCQEEPTEAGKSEKVEFAAIDFKKRNEALECFLFDYTLSPVESWKQHPDYHGLLLKTTYPGLMLGTGYPHELGEKEVIKAGFSFDYVTGLPYIPGSSLKGVLKHYFPKTLEDRMNLTYIQSAIPKLGEEEIVELANLIFNHRDVFLGAFPSSKNKDRKLLAKEYITPHPNPTKNPLPINLLKVKPDIIFEFGFILKDDILTSGKTVTADEKLAIFQMILMDMGIGAKTNVGFGRLVP